MGGFAIRSNVESQNPAITHLTAHSLLQLIHHDYRCIDFESMPSKEELRDRSKSNAFAKTLVVLQIVWFTTNCITRLARRLPTTQLEMSILGTAKCSLLSYFTIFGKPHTVKTATVVLSFDNDIPIPIINIIQSDGRLRGSRGTIKNRSSEGSGLSVVPIAIFTLLATILGAFHVAARSFAFPSVADKIVWRVNSLITCAVVFGAYFVMFVITPSRFIFP